MKLFKSIILIACLLAGLAVASCFAAAPFELSAPDRPHRQYHNHHSYNHYRQRPNYYGHGLHYYSYPYGGHGYYGYGAPTVIVVPQERSGWQGGTIYGRPYYKFGG